MRPILLTAMLAAAVACAPQEPPIPINYVSPGQIPQVPGNAAQQTERRVNREMQQETRRDRAADRDPYAGSMAGTPTPSTDMEIGGGDPEVAVPQIGIPFQ